MDITKHINVDRTLKELGVDIFKLKPNSEKEFLKSVKFVKKKSLKNTDTLRPSSRQSV